MKEYGALLSHKPMTHMDEHKMKDNSQPKDFKICQTDNETRSIKIHGQTFAPRADHC